MNSPVVDVSPVNKPYWEGLSNGELLYQHCSRCGNNWLPAREHCPHCLGANHNWQRSTGHGHIVSWVVYHVAYHESFKDKLPYNVAIVELEEGPRLLTNIVTPSPATDLCIGADVRLRVEYEDGQALARFELKSFPAPPQREPPRS